MRSTAAWSSERNWSAARRAVATTASTCSSRCGAGALRAGSVTGVDIGLSSSVGQRRSDPVRAQAARAIRVSWSISASKVCTIFATSGTTRASALNPTLTLRS